MTWCFSRNLAFLHCILLEHTPWLQSSLHSVATLARFANISSVFVGCFIISTSQTPRNSYCKTTPNMQDSLSIAQTGIFELLWTVLLALSRCICGLSYYIIANLTSFNECLHGKSTAKRPNTRVIPSHMGSILQSLLNLLDSPHSGL